jgi:hypothetical protein
LSYYCRIQVEEQRNCGETESELSSKYGTSWYETGELLNQSSARLERQEERKKENGVCNSKNLPITDRGGL